MRRTWLLAAAVIAACGGADGKDGRDGADGADGTDGSGLASAVYCSFYDATIGRAFGHGVYTFSDSSVLTTCEVQTGLQSTSGVRMYRAGRAGAATGYCQLISDIGSSADDGGWFSMERTGATSRATYHDVGDPWDGRFWTLSCESY